MFVRKGRGIEGKLEIFFFRGEGVGLKIGGLGEEWGVFGKWGFHGFEI